MLSPASPNPVDEAYNVAGVRAGEGKGSQSSNGYSGGGDERIGGICANTGEGILGKNIQKCRPISDGSTSGVLIVVLLFSDNRIVVAGLIITT